MTAVRENSKLQAKVPLCKPRAESSQDTQRVYSRRNAHRTEELLTAEGSEGQHSVLLQSTIIAYKLPGLQHVL